MSSGPGSSIGRRREIARQPQGQTGPGRSGARRSVALRPGLDLAPAGPGRPGTALHCGACRQHRRLSADHQALLRLADEAGERRPDPGARGHRRRDRLAQPVPLPAPGDDHTHRAAHGHRHPEEDVRAPDWRRLRAHHPRDDGPAGLEAHQRPLLHPAGRADRARRLRSRRPIVDRRLRGHALPRLEDDIARAGACSAGAPADVQCRPSPALRVASDADRARQRDLAPDREAGRRPADQGFPPRGLRDAPPDREFRGGVPAQDEGRARQGAGGAVIGGTGRYRRRRRDRVRLLAHRQRRGNGRRLPRVRGGAAARRAVTEVHRHGDDRHGRGPGCRRSHL